MDSKKRHELETNDLREFLDNFKDFWDRNGNGEITATEQRQSLIADFMRADSNNDATLDEDEFTGGMSVLVALRAAINPAPVE